MTRVLVVDDDAVTCGLLTDVLGDDETLVVGATEPRRALELARSDSIDLAIVDVQMPEMDGLTLLSSLREHHPGLPVIVMTAFGSIHTAVKAIGSGAVDYLSKPMDVDELRVTVRRALRRRHESRAELPSGDDDAVVGRSPAMVEVYKAIARVAPTPATVLIVGESGTGKELVARAIHQNGARRRHRFLAVDCSSLSETLLESELFGHVRGAFTGAVGDSPGLFAEADGGTIFLDEIGDVTPALQARLLRVLQEREVRPVGGARWRSVDARVIAATHRDLAAEVAAGRFREDLYYRLKVVTIELPALRERLEDVPLLVERLVQRAARETGRTVTGVSEAALALLCAHDWPGNVRELAHAIERAVVLAHHEVLSSEDFPRFLRRPDGSVEAPSRGAPSDRLAALVDDRPPLRELQRRYALAVLEENAGNVSRTAVALGIDRRSLHRLLQRYGVATRGVSSA